MFKEILWLSLNVRLALSIRLSDDDGSLSIPLDALNRPTLPVITVDENTPGYRECYCSYGTEEGICLEGEICLRDKNAACYHAIQECHSGLSTHNEPKSIACCYEGNQCNWNITPPAYAGLDEFGYAPGGPIGSFRFLSLLLTISALFIVLLLLPPVAYIIYNRIQDREKVEILDEESDFMLTTSGSGSRGACLNQRTVAQDLSILTFIGSGRFGQVRKALYRGSYVAVKTFYTTDEESWKNEREVYMTEMLNHENILQFVAADISSDGSLTQMLLITDYHECGSLSAYLHNLVIWSDEAVNLAYSIACGLDHLHSSVSGTGGRRKPQIAHRDMKSKNIIVKRPGVACIADFGLAVRFVCPSGDESDGYMVPLRPKVQVGTKRYMAPEILDRSLNPQNMAHFKMADMYSFALVMWEILSRVDVDYGDASSRHEKGRNEESESSGIGESLSSSKGDTPKVLHHKHSSDMSSRVSVAPFEGIVPKDASMEEMRKAVVDDNLRPPIDAEWSHAKNVGLASMITIMKESWHTVPQVRPSALKIKLELLKSKDAMKSRPLHKISDVSEPKEQKEGTDGGMRDAFLPNLPASTNPRGSHTIV